MKVGFKVDADAEYYKRWVGVNWWDEKEAEGGNGYDYVGSVFY